MPLLFPTSGQDVPQTQGLLSALSDTPERTQYAVFYSSLNEQGKLWCPDCQYAEEPVRKALAPHDKDSHLIYVGSPTEWRKADNEFRQPPWNVDRIPTIVKIQGQKWERLVEGDVLNEQKLKAFVN